MTPDLPDRSRWTGRAILGRSRTPAAGSWSGQACQSLRTRRSRPSRSENLAWQVYNQTGDDSELRALGVLPLLDAAEETAPPTTGEALPKQPALLDTAAQYRPLNPQPLISPPTPAGKRSGL